jgi:hypothetical protein
MVTLEGKSAVYSNWKGNTVQIDTEGQEFEFYDYVTEGGRLELANTASSASARNRIHARRYHAAMIGLLLGTSP